MNDAAGKIPFKEVAERLYKEMVEREYEGEPPLPRTHLPYSLSLEVPKQGTCVVLVGC
jgi:hypothetical protein